MDFQKGFLNQSLLGELEYHLIVGILECFGFLAVLRHDEHAILVLALD
jgi:hypothetical protein